MKYVKPLNETDVNASYKNADPANAQKGSTVPAEAIEHPQREIIAAIEEAGLTPSDSDLTQLVKAIKALDTAKIAALMATDAEVRGGALSSKIASVKQLDEISTAVLIADRLYSGVDLTVKFASEITAAGGDEWAWIKSRIQAGNYAGIHVGDYIPLTLSAGTVGADTIASQTLQMQIAGIDTYYGTGDEMVPHHIDFISREVIGKEIKWQDNNNNNGTALESRPWLTSKLYAWLNGVNNYTTSAYNNVAHGLNANGIGIFQRLPAKVQSVIVEKKLWIEQRYSASALLNISTGWAWGSMGKLWVPTENEVYGCQIWSAANSDVGNWGCGSMGAISYPLFANGGGFTVSRVKKDAGGTRRPWWLACVFGGISTGVTYVYSNGIANHTSASQAGVFAPVCFRVA